MNLAPNYTKSMEYLKGYSTNASFVLICGVGWKLPTFTTHYTTYRSYIAPVATKTARGEVKIKVSISSYLAPHDHNKIIVPANV
jgi:hypothetical protein